LIRGDPSLASSPEIALRGQRRRNATARIITRRSTASCQSLHHLDRRRAEGLNAHGRCRTNLDHFLVEAGDGFVRDALSAFLPNLHKRCADIRLWRGFSKFSMVDSHVSRRIPTIRLKNRRTFAPFTTFITPRSLVNWVNIRTNRTQY
jgi:hypothetical protein